MVICPVTLTSGPFVTRIAEHAAPDADGQLSARTLAKPGR